MKYDVDEVIKEKFAFLERFPQFKKSTIATLTHTFISDCELVDLQYLTIGWIARKLKVSESYVSRCCKDFFGDSPKNLLLRKKMVFARELLLESPGILIKQIAEMLDFCTVDYFIRVFKKQYRLTPLQYRKHRRREREKSLQLKKLALQIQHSINRTIREYTGGKYQRAVYVHGGLGKLRRKPRFVIDFLAPGYKIKN